MARVNRTKLPIEEGSPRNPTPRTTTDRENDVPSAVGALMLQAERLENEFERLGARISSVCSQLADREKKTNAPPGAQRTPLGADLVGIAERLDRSILALADLTDSIEL